MLDVKKIRFVTEQELSELTGGIQRGGVPPFGHLFGLQTYLDETLLKHHKIIFNAGDRRVSIAVFLKDYLAVEQPIHSSFSI